VKNKFLIVSLLFLVFYVFAFQGSRGIFESTEGRYANVAYVMLKTGDWIHPKLNIEQPHWTKPPLYYWTTALSMKMFGQNTFAVRFPGALAFLLSILLVFQLGKIFVPRRPWLAGIIYATCIMPFGASNAVSTDGLLGLFETAAMTCLVFLFFDSLSGKKRFFLSLASSAFFGLAFLTKGPPALLPILGVILFLFFDREARSSIKIRNLISGILVFVIIGIAWFFIVTRETPGLLTYFLRDEVVNRVATGQFKRNPGFWGGFIVYLPTLLLGSLPWTYYIFRGVYHSAKKMPQSLKDGGIASKHKELFLFFWFLIPLLVFFVADSRLPLYIQPLFVPLALLGAREVPTGLFQRKKIIILISSWAILLVLLRGLSGLFAFPQDSRILAGKLKKLCPQDYSEIVFVNTKPHYGLSIYLDIPIERVNFLKEPDSFFPAETIDEELLFDKSKILWMVPNSITKEFTEYLNAKDIQPDFLEWVEGKKVYGVYTLNQ